MIERTSRLSRRGFLLVAGAGGAVAAAAIVAKTAPQSPLRNPDKRATRGYQASEHVNRYYRTAKV